MHKTYVKQIEKDASYLVWKKDPDMRLDEEDRKFRRWIAKKSEHRPRCKGGAGMMSWKRHTEAFNAEWVLRYLHPGDAQWKELWDHILLIDDEGYERYPQGRAILISNLSKQDKARILKSIPKECDHMRTCIKDFWTMNITQNTSLPPDRNIAGEPFYGNYRFPNPIRYKDAVWWHNILETSCIGDLFNKTYDRPYTIQEWRDYIKEYYLKNTGKRATPYEVKKRIVQMKKILTTIKEADLIDAYYSPMEQPAIGDLVALCTNNETTYAYIGQSNKFQKAWIDNMGVPQDTGELTTYTQQVIEPVCFWTKVIDEHEMTSSDSQEFYQEIPRLIGPTNYSFPRDEGWKLNGKNTTLGAITIKKMTRQTGGLRDAPPNCQKAWRIRLQKYMGPFKLPWKQIWRSISTYFTTHRDELTWLKLTSHFF